MKHAGLVLTLSTLLVSCDDTNPSPGPAPAAIRIETNDSILPGQVASPEPPPRPSHNYADEEGGIYSYIAAISEEDRKRGMAAGSVSNFRYLGRNSNGEHIVASVTSFGETRYFSRCPDRCVIIRHSDGDQSAYNPGSIIGAVFEDAIRGQLKKWTPPRPPQIMTSQEMDAEDPPALPAASQTTPPAAPTEFPNADEMLPVIQS